MTIECFFWLVINLYHEGRNQPINGKMAICHSVLNRLENNPARYKSVRDVVLYPYQYSWANSYVVHGKDFPSMNNYKLVPTLIQDVIASIAIRKLGYTMKGATHYHTKDIDPYWTDSMDEDLGIIADHHFYRGR